MAHRKFTDAQGTEWEVWDVVPASVELGLSADESADATRPSRPLVSPDRFAKLDERLSAGRLCFNSDQEKRRHMPVPEGWERLPDEDLARLCREAEAVGPVRRTRPA